MRYRCEKCHGTDIQVALLSWYRPVADEMLYIGEFDYGPDGGEPEQYWCEHCQDVPQVEVIE